MRPVGLTPLPTPPRLPPELVSAGKMIGQQDAQGLSPGQSASDRTLQPFADLLLGQVEQVGSMQSNADDLVHQLLTGQDVNQAEVLTAVQKADLAFRMMLQVRNKLVEAFRELQQIQI